MSQISHLEKLIDEELKVLLGLQSIQKLSAFGKSSERLTLAFKIYKENIQFQQMFRQNTNNQFAKQLTRYIVLEQKYSQIISLNIGGSEQRVAQFGENVIKQRQRGDKLKWEVTCLTEYIKTLQNNISELKQQKNKVEQKLFQDTQMINRLSKQLQFFKNQDQSIRKNELQYKKEVEKLNDQIKTLRQTNEQNRIKYQQIFLAEFKKIAQDNQKKQRQIRECQKKKLRDIITNLNQQIKTIIDTVNEILQINCAGSQTIEGWLKQFKKSAKKYNNEVNKVLNRSQKRQGDPLYQLAQLQKERITAKRMHLLNLME